METLGEKEPTYVTVSVDTTHKVSDHYDVGKKLGEGSFGQVYLLCHKQTGEFHAGKFYRSRRPMGRAEARREMDITSYLSHPKLVQYLAAYDTHSEVVMVMEYIAGGELFERIVHESFEYTEPTSVCYMKQILEGMQYVHAQGIVHLDLKPDNIVCVDSASTQIKIIDFGLARKLEPGKELNVLRVNAFTAPEVVNFKPVALEADMWSIGVICFILLSGESPFQGDNILGTLALVVAARYEFDEETFEDISDEARDFISSLLQKDQRRRLSCDQALAHPWVVSFPRPTITRSLSKEKMKCFLARPRWKEAALAVKALNRKAALSYRPDAPREPTEELSWCIEAEEDIERLDEELQREPRFQRTLRDTVLSEGASAELTCLVDGEKEPAYVTVSVDTTHKVSDHYDKGKKLGEGTFGQVYLLRHKQTGEVHAGKFFCNRTSEERAAARREMDIMNYLSHPKLVQYLAAYDTPSEIVIVMEYIAGGELFERIVHKSFEYTEPTCVCYMKQILEGMQYVHAQGIVHLDLKPDNIVCTDSAGTQIKIIDFGLARKLEPGKELKVMHGTPEFISPEVVNYEPVSLETDMWSIGVICFILLSGYNPFQGDNTLETLALVTAARYEFDEKSFKDISDEAKNFISSLLQKDQRRRLSCDQALAHPWVVSFPHPTITRSLSKEKMKCFLARPRWKEAALAVMALKRKAALSYRPDAPREPTEEAEQDIERLDEELQREPRFQRTLRDTAARGGYR